MEEQEKRFVELLEQKKTAIKEDVVVQAAIIQSLLSVFERYYGNDKTFVKKVQLLEQHTRNLIHTKKDSLPLFDRCSTKFIAEDLLTVIDSAIEEVKAIGLPKPNIKDVSRDININNTLNQSQEQNQEQNLIVSILLEAIKDDLTGKQRKEVLEAAKSAKTPEEAHKSIMDKLKEFGANVSASIVANILTNPNVWETIGSII